MGEIPKRTGILISSSITDNPRYDAITFRFEVSENTPSQTFLTNPTIRQLLLENKIQRGTTLGVMTLNLHHSRGCAEIVAYFPFATQGFKDIFSKKGIAQLLEYRALQLIKKRYPGIVVIAHKL